MKISQPQRDNFSFVLLAIYVFGGLGVEALRRVSFRFENVFFAARIDVTDEAVVLLLIQTLLLASYFTIGRLIVNLPPIDRRVELPSSTSNIIAGFTVLVGGLYVTNHVQYLWIEYPERFNAATYTNAVITFGSAGLLFALNLHKFSPLSALSGCLIIFSFTYPAATGARAASLPFLAIAGAAFLGRRPLASTFWAALGLKALIAALMTRADPSFTNFLSNFLSFDPTLLFVEQIPQMVSASFPGAYTTQLALQAQRAPDSLLSNVFYLSPVPSTLLPATLFERSTFSDVLGIDPNVLGINVDLYSDPFYRGGYLGVILYPMFTVILYFVSISCASAISSKWRYLWISVSRVIALYGMLGGMVFTYRAATRWQFALIAALSFYIWLYGKKKNDL